MNIELIKNYSGIVDLGQEWAVLLQRSRANTIFLSHEWICSWLKVHEHNIDLYVLTVRDDRQRLVGIAPLYRAQIQFCGALNYQSLRIIGDYASGSDYLDIIVDKGCEVNASAAILEYLLTRQDWDVIWIPKIASSSNACSALTSLFAEYNLTYQVRSVHFSKIELPELFDDYLNRLRPSKRKEVTYKWRRLNRKAKVEVDLCSNLEDLEKYLEHLFILHKLRWKDKNLPGVFDRKPDEENFYRTFAPIALQNNWLRIFILSCDSVVQAVQYGYEYNGCFYSIQEGFNPEYYSGIGNLLRFNVIQWCIENKLKCYDFLADHSDHKISWSATPQKGCHIFALRKNLKNRFLSLLGVWPMGRYMSGIELPI